MNILHNLKSFVIGPKNAPSKKEAKLVINNVDVRPWRRETSDIAKWRNAMIMAEGFYEQRAPLFNLYKDMLLDGVLTTTIEKRINKILNCNIRLVKDAVPHEGVHMITGKTFFETFLREAMNAKFWGHSLLELYWPAPGSIDGSTTLIPRKHVKPKLGVVTRSEYDFEGIKYREDPYRKNLVEIGDPEDLGLLLQVSQYVIYKRGNFGDWAEFTEVFGMPFRWATYNNEESRQVLEKALSEAGAAGYVVAPKDAELQFHNHTAGAQSQDIYRYLLMACNQEIATTILGNSMTTIDSKTAGHAQSYTQSNEQDDLHEADRKFILRTLNEKLNPYLASIGYDVMDHAWEFEDDDQIPLQDRITIDTQVAGFVDIPDEYWYEKYKIPRPSGSDTQKKKSKPPTG